LSFIAEHGSVSLSSTFADYTSKATAAVLATMTFYWAFVLLLTYSIDHTNGVCVKSLALDHGKVTYKDNGFSVLFECDPGYKLQGSPELPCNEDGLITELKPFCASKC